MTSHFKIFPPGDGPTDGYGTGENARRRRDAERERAEAPPADAYQVRQMQRELEHNRQRLRDIESEPLMIATIVEMRGKRMLVSFGPGNAIDIATIEDAKVGKRVRCHRSTMQAIDIVSTAEIGETEIPTGMVVTVLRQNGDIVEANFGSELRVYRSTFQAKAGERVVLDPSASFVIGSLGMPPADFSFATKISVSWDDIGGQDEAKAALREAIELPFSHPELFKRYGKRHVAGVLLSGPPGTGKTLLAKAAATALARAHGKDAAEGYVYVKGPELLNSYIGRSEEAIRRLFAAARDHHKKHGYPALVFIDECDALLGKRDHGANVSVNATTVPQFLAEMDGLSDKSAVLILATNRPDMLDPAVVREGRVDRRVKVGRPTLKDARAIFEICLRGRPLQLGSADQDLSGSVAAYLYDDVHMLRKEPMEIKLSNFASGAMFAGIVEQATTQAMMRDIAGTTGGKKAKAAAETSIGITQDDLMWAVDQAKARLADVSHIEVMREILEAQAAIS